jgi:hypothetical protein
LAFFVRPIAGASVERTSAEALEFSLNDGRKIAQQR